MADNQKIQFKLKNSIGSLEFGKPFISGPRGIAYRPSDHLLFIADSKNERVVGFTEDNKLAKIISHYGTKNGLCIMSNGQLLMTDETQILLMNNDLRLVRAFGQDDIDAGFTNYQGVCVDNNDLIYICDQATRQIKVYDPKTLGIVRFFGNKNLFSSLAYCTVNNDHCFITDPQGSCVHKFTTDGQFVSRFGIETNEYFQKPLSSPRGIIPFNNGKHLLVADSHNDRLVVFDNDGKFVQLIRESIDYPESLATNKNGDIFVAMRDTIGLFSREN